ncbi:MAG TPA: M48 family metalloprotease [Flavobacteriales bacterium]|nr:M48 family metalloprotease [Flavobacteriales bacterium]
MNLKRKSEKIKRSEYNTVKQAEMLINRTLTKLMSQQRKQELEADSLGLIFYNNLGLDKSHALHDIAMLDSAEIPYYHAPIDFKKKYDPAGSFFKDDWLQAEKLKYTWHLDSAIWFIPDSLKTHPDCKERLKRIAAMSAAFTDRSHSDQNNFIYLRNVARFEILEELLSNEDYASSLYAATQLLVDYPENIYLHNVIVNSFIEMANALKDHRFSQVVDHPHELYYPGFNSLLSFLHHLNSSELKKFAVNYFNIHLQTVTNDAFTAYNAILIKAWETSKEKLPALIDLYKTNFKDKFYIKQLVSKFKPKK